VWVFDRTGYQQPTRGIKVQVDRFANLGAQRRPIRSRIRAANGRAFSVRLARQVRFVQ
jgi:hypothetical protein